MAKAEAYAFLVKQNHYFAASDAGTLAMEFYLDGLALTDSMRDLDDWAHLNTLFGYRLYFDDAMQIVGWLWDPEKNGEREYEVSELSFKDRELLQMADAELGLGLRFDCFRKSHFERYRYKRK